MDRLHSYVSRHQIEMQVFAIKLVFQSDNFVYNLGLTLSLHLKRTIIRYKKLKALFSFFLFCRPIIVAQKASNVLLDILQFLQRFTTCTTVMFIFYLLFTVSYKNQVDVLSIILFSSITTIFNIPHYLHPKVKTKWTANPKWQDPSSLALPRFGSHTEQISCTGNKQIFIFLNFSIAILNSFDYQLLLN